ncbi:MAG TPA: hypothetical protein VNP04_01295, partial [Alphaproteobacteria bacterium]|nr:hypothetical protein [Alphaproteobacteria bacterium]
MQSVSKAPMRQNQRRWGLLWGLLLVGLALGGCGDAPSPSTATKPSAPVTAAKPPAMIRFSDVTAAAGLDFRHEAGASGQKWYPETMGAGGGFFDYDGDGWPDILLINGRRWPGERQEP